MCKESCSVSLDVLDSVIDLIDKLYLLGELCDLLLDAGILRLHFGKHLVHLLDGALELLLEFSVVAGLSLAEAELLLLLLILELALEVPLSVAHRRHELRLEESDLVDKLLTQSADLFVDGGGLRARRLLLPDNDEELSVLENNVALEE